MPNWESLKDFLAREGKLSKAHVIKLIQTANAIMSKNITIIVFRKRIQLGEYKRTHRYGWRSAWLVPRLSSYARESRFASRYQVSHFL